MSGKLTVYGLPQGGFGQAAIDALCAGQPGLHSASGDTSMNGSVPGRRYITYAGGALSIVLTAPIAGADDGKKIQVKNVTTQQHTVTCTGLLNDGAGHNNTLTFAAHAGGEFEIEAYQGAWYVNFLNGVTGS